MKQCFGFVLVFSLFLNGCGGGGSTNSPAISPIPTIPAPSQLTAIYDRTSVEIKLTWLPPVGVIDGFNLEGRFPDGNFSQINQGLIPSNWNGAILTFNSIPNDQEIIEFRIYAVKGGINSQYSNIAEARFPPLAPTFLSTQSLPSGVRLTWENRSKTASQITITRIPAGPNGSNNLATLSPSANFYLDDNLPLAYYKYGITVSDGTNSTSSPYVVAAPENPPGSPILVGQPLTYNHPLTDTFALSPNGLWAFGITDPLTVFPASWATWPAWSPSNEFAQLREFLKLDTQSRPHVVYKSQNASKGTLIHEWFDGSNWINEVIQEMPVTTSYLFTAFCLDKANNLYSLQDIGITDIPGLIANLVYSYKIAGTWTHESLDTTSSSDWFDGNPTLYLDPSGTPHVLVPTRFNTREYSRNHDGSWTSQILPNTPGAYDFEDGVWLDANTATVFYQESDKNKPGNDAFWVVQKVNGVWQPPVLLKSFAHTIQPMASIALSADGTRVAAVCETFHGLMLFTRSPQGWVESLLPTPDLDFPKFKVGFDVGNRLHVLVKPSGYTTEMVDLHE